MTHAEIIADLDKAIKAIDAAQAALQRLFEHMEAKPEPHALANFLAFSHEGDEHGNNLGVGAV